VTECLTKQLKRRKDLFSSFYLVSEISAPLWWGVPSRAAHIMVDRKQSKRKEPGAEYNLQRHTPSDLLSSGRPPSPKASTTSQNSATFRRHSIQHMSLWETFHIQTMTSSLENVKKKIFYYKKKTINTF
jgi:hypothetical protein